MKVVAVVLLALTTTALPATSANADAGEPFRIGVYLYENHFEAAAREHGRDYANFLDEHLRILRDHGVNAIYLGATTRERFDDHLLAPCRRRSLKGLQKRRWKRLPQRSSKTRHSV